MNLPLKQISTFLSPAELILLRTQQFVWTGEGEQFKSAAPVSVYEVCNVVAMLTMLATRQIQALLVQRWAG